MSYPDDSDLELQYRRWPRVTSPLARRIVRIAYDCSPNYVWRRPEPQQQYSSDPELREYRERIRARLANSDLAERLAHGTDMLPDFLAALPPSSQVLQKFFKPRNYEQLIRHVIKYLDWYLDPQAGPPVLRRITPWHTGFGLTVYLAAAAASILYAVSVPGLGGLLAGSCAIAILLYGLASAKKKPNQLPGARLPEQIAVNASEFYLYIKTALADPEEDEADPGKDTV